MHITYRPMTATEAWTYIEKLHQSFHSHLKHFGYKYDMNIPDHPAMRKMYENEKLTLDQIQKYRDIFISKIYNVNDLKKLDSILAMTAIPALKTAVNILAPLAKRWGINLPDKVEIVTTYGDGGAYDSGGAWIIKMFRPGKSYNPLVFERESVHEFIHLLIEWPIIKKYNVPQDLKERIVDIIGQEYCNIPVDDMFDNQRFEDSFANKYITREAIENDLPGAVRQMMNDYTVFKVGQQLNFEL